MIPQKKDWARIEEKTRSFFQKTFHALSRFFQGFVDTLKDYIRSKIRHMPATLPPGAQATIEGILEQKHHQEHLLQFSNQTGVSIEQVEQNFKRYLNEIAADLNYMAFPFWDGMLTWAFETIYEGFEINESKLNEIRELTKEKPVVFVSNHRSHIDYLLLSYVFYHHRIPMPHICAGANLSFWPMGPIFRKSGGFFIRRSYDGNKLYTYAVQAYIEQLIRHKASLEFFIEGTRSRTGKLLPPKMGILTAVAEALYNKAAEDIALVPVSISYESVLEEKSYAEEQGGKQKKEESLLDLFNIRKYLKNKKGKVYLQFGDTISLKDHISSSTIFQKREKVEQLAYELTYNINKCTVVTPSSLSALSLLTHYGRSVSESTMTQKVERYLNYLHFKGSRLTGPLLRSTSGALREALKNYQKSDLVEIYDDHGSPLYHLPEGRRSLLDYYKNNSIHFFVSIAVLSTILKTMREDEVTISALESDYLFIKKLFKHEFTFSRRQNPRTHLEKTFEYFEQRQWVRREGERIRLSPEARYEIDFFAVTLRNYFEAYFILWNKLPELKDRRWELRELIKFLKEQGTLLYLKEEIHFSESINRFILQNALLSFRDLGILGEEKEGWGKRKKTYYYVKELDPEIGRNLMKFINKY